MRAVESRTRLEQLQDLERRTRLEVDAAISVGNRDQLTRLAELEKRVAAAIREAGGTPLPTRFPPKRRTARDFVSERLQELGVDAHGVKVWAVSVGLEERVRRGRVRMELVEAYANATGRGGGGGGS